VNVCEEWLPISEAFSQLRRYFRTMSALKHHLSKRAENGLSACDAVRMSPLGRLLVNPARVRRWIVSEGSHKTA
jgi:hypothetical protein